MYESLQSDNTYSRQQLIKSLHVIMMALCLIATLFVFIGPSGTTKQLICILLVGYAVVIIFSNNGIKSIFKLGQSSEG